MDMLRLGVFCLLNIAALRIGGASNAPRTMSNPQLVSESSNITMGRPASIRCLFRNASFPVTFMLFLNDSSKGKKTVSEEGEATFNITISDPTSLGMYKCKANNSATNGMYSKGFRFVLQEHTTHGPGPSGRGWTLLAWLIPLLVLAIIIAAFVSWRIYKPAAKQEVIHDNNTYENVSARETERCKEQEAEEDVEYCTVILREGSRDVIRAEETAEYMDIADTPRLQVQQQP